jgi:hypothetical protein
MSTEEAEALANVVSRYGLRDDIANAQLLVPASLSETELLDGDALRLPWGRDYNCDDDTIMKGLPVLPLARMA